MNWEKLAQELALPTGTKIVLLVLDGVGGIAVRGRTELEAAFKPNLDRLARQGACGLTDPVFMGITPGSGPAHLSLFGYDPLQYQLGRGILEALGSDVEVGKNDLVARGNFATLKDGLIVDRRAGRIATEENKRLCEKVNRSLPCISGIEVAVFPGKEHRFVVRFRGEGLSASLSDGDPQKDNKPPVPVRALSEEAKFSAEVTNVFMEKVTEIIKDHPAANAVLLRGFSKLPSLPTMAELYKIRAAAVANYPMYKGLARIVGMKVLDTDSETADLFDTLEKHYLNFDFFYVHFKKTDAAGEDGNFEAKVRAIEEIDRFLPRLIALDPDVLVITSDHSTPSPLRSHSWHPNPFLLVAKSASPDRVASFSEKQFLSGSLGRFPSLGAMSLMLAHAGKMKKFGA